MLVSGREIVRIGTLFVAYLMIYDFGYMLGNGIQKLFFSRMVLESMPSQA